MSESKIDIPARLRESVRHYWNTRSSQGDKQGIGGNKDAGQRSSVTGGKQLDGFAHLLCDLLVEEGMDRNDIYFGKSDHIIPGFYRPTKDWDLLVIAGGQLWIAVELKSQVGPSFVNNYNNRVEEGLGNAADIRRRLGLRVLSSDTSCCLKTAMAATALFGFRRITFPFDRNSETLPTLQERNL
jgi:hypothetical protein